MTSNSTVRRLTTKRARQLTRVLKHMAKKLKFDSFDLHFVENPFKVSSLDMIQFPNLLPRSSSVRVLARLF